MSRALILVIAIALSGCSFGGQYQARKSFTETADHIDGASLSVLSQNGSVQIIADANVSAVEIEANVYCKADTQAQADTLLEEVALTIERDDARHLKIQPKFPDEKKWSHGASVIVRVPSANGVTAKTSNGKVTIAGLEGELVADTSNASVVVSDHRGPARIETSNGSIKVTRLQGGLIADTSNGSVEALDVGGPLKVDTSNGSITIKLNPQHSGPIALDTSNGSIKATVGSQFNGVVKLDTSNSGIRIHDRIGRITSQTISHTSGRITIGEGGQVSSLDTSNGRIELVIAD